jgi:hypothetical protein
LSFFFAGFELRSRTTVTTPLVSLYFEVHRRCAAVAPVAAACCGFQLILLLARGSSPAPGRLPRSLANAH